MKNNRRFWLGGLSLFSLLVTLTLAVRFYQSEVAKGPRSATYSLPKVNAEVTLLRHETTDLERIQDIHTWHYRSHSLKPQSLFPVIYFVKEGKTIARVAGPGDGDREQEVSMTLVGDWTQSKTLKWVFMTPTYKSSQTIENPFFHFRNANGTSPGLAGRLLEFDATDDTFRIYGFPFVASGQGWGEDRQNRVYLGFRTIGYSGAKLN